MVLEYLNLFLGISENFVNSYKKSRYKLIFSKNHSDLSFSANLTSLVPKSLEIQIFSENILTLEPVCVV